MLQRARMRAVCVKQPLPGHGGHAFAAEGTTLLADVQPMSVDMPQRMYGLEPGQMRRVLCERDAPILPGDGVCVEVPPESEPDFRVVYAAKWSRHTDVHLRFIPEAERGADL